MNELKPILELDLTDSTYQKLLNEVVKMGRARKNNNALMDEAEFFTGAMTVMATLGLKLPIWTLFIMSGRSILDEWED